MSIKKALRAFVTSIGGNPNGNSIAGVLRDFASFVGCETNKRSIQGVLDDIYADSASKSTVLYSDGRLIINELKEDREANIAIHGAVDKEYVPMGLANPYIFSIDLSTGDMSKAPVWVDPEHPEDIEKIKSVSIGSRIKPSSIAFWFVSLTGLESIDLTGLDTSSVTSMFYAFAGVGLTELDLRNFDTSMVKDFSGMFTLSQNLAKILVSDDFIVSEDANTTMMFAENKSLVGGNGTAYSEEHVDGEYARIYTAETPGYFTKA